MKIHPLFERLVVTWDEKGNYRGDEREDYIKWREAGKPVVEESTAEADECNKPEQPMEQRSSRDLEIENERLKRARVDDVAYWNGRIRELEAKLAEETADRLNKGQKNVKFHQELAEERAVVKALRSEVASLSAKLAEANLRATVQEPGETWPEHHHRISPFSSPSIYCKSCRNAALEEVAKMAEEPVDYFDRKSVPSGSEIGVNSALPARIRGMKK